MKTASKSEDFEAAAIVISGTKAYSLEILFAGDFVGNRFHSTAFRG